MGEVMRTMWDQLGVKHLNTSVYHPQYNGLVERFNSSLKTMLRKFAVENPISWPQMVELVLFAIKEVPQASKGFSPFELLFGRCPRGILDLLCDQWIGREAEQVGVKPVDVETLRGKLQRLAEWARANLREAQEEQRHRYDLGVRKREFKQGDSVALTPYFRY